MLISIRYAWFSLLIILFLNACSGGGSDNQPASPLAPLAERYAIEGVVNLAAAGAVHEKDIDIMDNFGTGSIAQTSTIRWTAINDDRELYIALEWDDNTRNAYDPSGSIDDFDGVVVVFDNNGNGLLEENEDARRLIMTDYGSVYGDLHVQGTDLADDAVGDGKGKMTYTGGQYHAEFLIPLVADAAGDDGVLTADTRFTIMVYDHIQILLQVPSGNIGMLAGLPTLAAGTDATSWEQLPYSSPGTYDQPNVPSSLTGLIAFISDSENPKGEIYTFDLSTRTVNRVTNGTGLYLDGVSLSHDRTKVAFYAAPANTDFANYEIYTVNIDGSNLKPVTSNSILDGHPAWSPGDTEIVYASFRDAANPWIASLIRSTPSGTEIANLTPSGVNDNDPDWLPDGRIVFKTDRFSIYPEVRIAMMNADGSNVVQLTDSAGTSDHDPVSINTAAVFERFTKGTDYSADPSSPFSAWDIIETGSDGSGERILIADGWVNWLPVYGPTKQYLVYLKSVGYTEARLMDNNGQDLGRLIPDQTKIRYIDWK